MDLLAIVGGLAGEGVALATAAEGETAAGLQINLFWIVVASANFVVLLILLYVFALGPLRLMLDERRARIEEGLRDAEQARRDRESAEEERASALQEARREANDILARAQRVAQETRESDIAATREELERLRERATSEIDAERQRAIADLRSEVADLALRAAGRVIGETMTKERERRLVEQFLEETADTTENGKT